MDGGRGETDLVEGGVVESCPALHASRLALDSDEVLLEWNRSERRVKVEETLVSINTMNEPLSSVETRVQMKRERTVESLRRQRSWEA